MIETDDITKLIDRIYSEYKDASVLKMCHTIAVNIQSKLIRPLEDELERCYAEIADKETIIAEMYERINDSNVRAEYFLEMKKLNEKFK